MSVSQTAFTTRAPINYAADEQETRTTYSTQHNGETCECHLPSLPYPPCTLRQILRSSAESPLSSLSSNRPAATVLYCTILSYTPYIHTNTYNHLHTHTLIWDCVVFCCVLGTCTPSRARQSPPVSVAQMIWAAAASPQPRCTCAALHGTGCTALAPQAGIGLDGGAGLAAERTSERAKWLSYCAARLVSLSLFHHWASVHFQISTHWPPRSIPTRLPTHPSSPD